MNEKELQSLEEVAQRFSEKPKEPKSNIINVRVDEFTFRRIMAIGHAYAGGSMSDVVRTCINTSLDSVEEYYKGADKLKRRLLETKP
jgi:hypothetical protein